MQVRIPRASTLLTIKPAKLEEEHAVSESYL
jgi:hypothetical protein